MIFQGDPIIPKKQKGPDMKTIFVSSTFRDMQYERDAIRELTAPLLNAEAVQYGDAFDFCDLRWGIDTRELDERQGSEKVLNICLDEIDRCQPPMVVLLGYRYGWIPGENLLRTAAERKNIRLADPEMSVTALEIEYGSLLTPERFKIRCSTSVRSRARSAGTTGRRTPAMRRRAKR